MKNKKSLIHEFGWGSFEVLCYFQIPPKTIKHRSLSVSCGNFGRYFVYYSIYGRLLSRRRIFSCGSGCSCLSGLGCGLSRCLLALKDSFDAFLSEEFCSVVTLVEYSYRIAFLIGSCDIS